MEGPFKGHAPTGEMIELFGMFTLELNENNKIVKVEVFYDRGELLGKLVKEERLETKDGEVASSFPILKNTG
ncbi:NTF2-like domain containing protein [Trema orientale]|uniref:NTF2-like domain containing protein n=1 Tax=Trema orientale TaxID=63057 RepID=A0A2P5FPK5_TREOI|nr:NTF2-like domain containing protein [Trema orientale]